MKKNDIVTVTIHAVNSKGEGVAKKDEFVFFVPYAIEGETVVIQVLKIKKNIIYGKLLEVIEKSEFRTNPICEQFLKCGGCSYLHIQYEKQLEIKKEKVYETLKRIGKIDTAVSDTLGADSPFYYRNKALIPVSNGKNGEIVAGFFRNNSHDVINSTHCWIQDQHAFLVVLAVKEWMEAYGIPPYDEIHHTGVIRHIYFRRGIRTDEIMAGVVTYTKELPHKKELVSILKEKIDGLVSVIQNVNPNHTNIILGEDVYVLYEKDVIKDKILNHTFLIGSLSFYQVNPYMVEKLYQTAIDLLDLKSHEILFDIYCGIGTIGICAAHKVKEVIGVEVVPEAIRLAKENAKLNEITNAKFFVGKAEDIIFDLIQNENIPNAVVLDPPRAGCDKELITEIKKLDPEKICYVSCDVATLARDLNLLVNEGQYKIKKVVPVDMFPNTPHVETVVLITRVK